MIEFDYSKLVERLKREDVSALGELYEILSKKIYNRCCFILKNQELAEDATQEVFLKAFNQIKSLKEDLKIESWINRMAYNHCIDVIRKNQKDNEVSTQLENHSELVDFVRELEEISESEKFKKELYNELDQLSESERLAIMLFYWEGFSISEISDHLDLGESAVKMKLSRTRIKLKERLIDKGVNHSLEISILLLLNLI